MVDERERRPAVETAPFLGEVRLRGLGRGDRGRQRIGADKQTLGMATVHENGRLTVGWRREERFLAVLRCWANRESRRLALSL